MKRVSGEALRRIQLEILNVVADFCEKEGITYWIDSGTLLGAIRHKGYIPWDDDIDIGMLREDYEKFLLIFNKHNTRYKLVCLENTPDFYLPYGKVCDTSTVLYEPDENGHKLFINVDIFVYDNVPNDDRVLKEMYDKRDSLRKRYTIGTENVVSSGNIVKTAIKRFRRAIYRLCFPCDSLMQAMAENAKRFAGKQTECVGNFTAYTRMICNKRVFESFIDVEFEGRYYKAPVGYDEWLTSFYGNYMELPPVEKRVSHHGFIAYVCDED